MSITQQQLLLIVINKGSDPLKQLTELRKNLAWAGLPAAFVIEEMTAELEQIFTQHKVTRWITTPINEEKLSHLAAELIEI